MKSKELRIGNKLQKDNGEVFTVLRLDNTDDVLVEEERGLLTLDYNLFGIPLTEEWLLKFGFEKDDVEWYSLGSISVHLKRKRMVYTNPPKDGVIEAYNELPFKEYVHDFQNLYSTLEATELRKKKNR